MRFTYLRIRHFKSIEDMEIKSIENALILVGKNNTGKTSVLDAIRLLTGSRPVKAGDFNEKVQNIEMEVSLEITKEDLGLFHKRGAVSAYKRFSVWEQEVRKRLPSFQEQTLSFTCTINQNGNRRFGDGIRKHNKYIEEMLPRISYINGDRDMGILQSDLLLAQTKMMKQEIQAGSCIFDGAKTCRHCFQCIGLIHQKKPEELSIMELSRLMEFKMYQVN